MTRTRIADFEVGRPTEGEFAVLRKTRLRNRNGDPYLALELSDSTGRIQARVWDNAEYFDRNVHPGDRVVAVGKPSLFRDELQFDIRRLERADGTSTEAFIPAASRDLDELVGELEFLIDDVEEPFFAQLVRGVWQGTDRERLVRSPATPADHHCYLGGLVEHTIGVASICLAAAERHERLDRQLLLSAALLHDVGRAREIEVGETVGVDLEGGLHGHVLLTHEMLIEAAVDRRDPQHQQRWSQLLHAIASHHGPAERCRSGEATTLLMANSMDARLGQTAR